MANSSSSDVFWDAVERIYGDVPNLLKLVLKINGFDSFLALKGIRYDDKIEFFKSLEMTVMEVLSSEHDDDEEKKNLELELKLAHNNLKHYRMKPGHRNYIMNLMMEIEKVDVNEFFGRNTEQESKLAKEEAVLAEQIEIEGVQEPQYAIIVDENDNEDYQDEETQDLETEYIFEEEYLSDGANFMQSVEIECETIAVKQENRGKRKKSTSTQPKYVSRKPEQMYNEEFIAKSLHPRRRRISSKKKYPHTEEGIRERFNDLLTQSMECILPADKLALASNVELQLGKDQDGTWIVYCPLCKGKVKLPVVLENNGRYWNYKRCNFERHLRFRHCKKTRKSWNETYYQEMAEGEQEEAE